MKPMAPGSIFHHINLPTTSYFWRSFYFTFFTLHLYHKNTKNIILSYLSDLTLVCDHVGIDNPLSRWLRGFICLCRCSRGTNAVLKRYQTGFLAPLPGSLRKSQHTKYPSQILISRITLFATCLSFSCPPLHPCRFIRSLSFPFAFLFLFALCTFCRYD